MAAPAAAIVGGAVTIWLALASADGLVADDYYKQGLAINQVIGREQTAERLGIALRIERLPGVLAARFVGGGAPPEALQVRLAHATRAGNDLRLRLAHRGGGVYESALPPLAAGHWRVVVEDPRREWRVAGDWSGAPGPFVLGAREAKR
jgi:hypothetical protein